MIISKSNYVKFKLCKKALWLHKNKPEEAGQLSPVVIQQGVDGNMVGEIAKTYFPGLIDASRVKEDGSIDIANQIAVTKECLKNGTNSIAEASFSIDDMYCAVDILVRHNDGYDIYEVKSSKVKEKQLIDIAYQKYILTKYGLKIYDIYLMHPNKDYVFDGKLDVNKFFEITCVNDDSVVLKTLDNVSSDMKEIQKYLSITDEPKTVFCDTCDICEFKDYCFKDLPDDNIGRLHGMNKKAFPLYNDGIYTIEEYTKTPQYLKSIKTSKDKVKKVQIQKELNKDYSIYVNKDKLNEYLSGIKYPIYHLDFETTYYAIPVVKGFKPREVFPFQYSLHIEHEDGRIEHKEYLASDVDCTRELAERLCNDIPKGSQLMAYNASVEKGVICNLANRYSDLKDHLMDLYNNFVDLETPFENCYYYNYLQRGSCSIKDVMPAICPENKDAYHELSGVSRGDEAQVMFPKMLEMKGTPEYEETRKGMLAYCEQDTKSMVDVLAALRELVK